MEWNVSSDLDLEGGWIMEDRVLILIAPLRLFSGKAEIGKNTNINLSEEVRGEEQSSRRFIIHCVDSPDARNTSHSNIMAVLIRHSH